MTIFGSLDSTQYRPVWTPACVDQWEASVSTCPPIRAQYHRAGCRCGTLQEPLLDTPNLMTFKPFSKNQNKILQKYMFNPKTFTICHKLVLLNPWPLGWVKEICMRVQYMWYHLCAPQAGTGCVQWYSGTVYPPVKLSLSLPSDKYTVLRSLCTGSQAWYTALSGS